MDRTADDDVRDEAEQLIESIECVCGVNAFATPEQLEQSRYADMPAVGCVLLEGEVRAFERGWRAERARVHLVWAATWLHAERVREAAEACGAIYMGRAGRFDLEKVRQYASS
jgi:hypothetical protein